MPCAYLTDTASAIWGDLGQPTDTPVSYIQSKLTSAPFLGKLNALTANCYVIVTGTIAPPLGNEEQAIYAAMFEADYYTRKANALMNGTDIDYIRLQDGDSTITRATTLDKARFLAGLQKQAETQLGLLIASYRQGLSNGRSIDFYGINSNWSAGYGYGNGPTVGG